MTAIKGMLTVEELAGQVQSGAIDTVLVVFTDHYGRFMGKRFDAEFFVDDIAGQGTHSCNYLLTVDMEMEPVPGYAFASWERGYGDFHLVPDLSTLRVASWLDKTALVVCDVENERAHKLVEQAPRTILRKQIDRVASPSSGGKIDFRLDSTGGTLVGTVNVPNTGGWQNWTSVELTSLNITGVHDLYLVFSGGLNVNWFRFRPSSALPGLPEVKYEHKMLANRRNYDVTGVSPMYMSRLMTVTTELGGQVVFTYGQSHACPSSPSSNIRLPYDCFPAWDPGDPNISTDDGWVLWNKWKVIQLQKSDSFSGNDAESYTYSYSTPTWHYSDEPTLPDINGCPTDDPCFSRHWNDFRGSEVVTVTDGSGAKSEHRFFRGMDDDRLGTGGGVYDASIVLSSGTYTGTPSFEDKNWWRGREVETRRLKSDNSQVHRTVNWYMGTLTAGSGISGAYFSGPQRTEQTWYGELINKTTATGYEYGDSYGNVTRQILYGDLSDNNDNRNIQRSYVYSTTVGYLVDRPQWEKLWTGTDSNGTLQARTDYLYDNTLTLGATPTKGNLTESRRYHTATNYYPSYTGYDGYGRPTVLTDARSKQTVTAYHSFYGYVSSVTRFINSVSHVTSYVSDPKWGVVTQTTDPNNKVTTLQYDSYGRLEKVWLPTEPTNGVASLVYSYTLTSYPAYVQSSTLQVRSSATYLQSREYVDGFGRSLQSERPSVTSGYRVVSSQKYNNLGQVAYSSAPYQLTGNLGAAYAPPNWDSVANYHQYLYEEMGRLFVDYTRSGSSTPWYEYTFYDAWWHRHYDPNDNRTDTYVDAFGQPVQVTEFNSGGAAYNTAYAYDKQGNLTRTTDQLGNTTWITYNLAGWKTAMTDPDMGTWSYNYDAVGNLQTQTDARNQTLYFKYDDLNRTVEKRQTNATGALIADYTFDAAGQKGLLSKSRAYSGANTTEVQYVTYDALNRLTQQNWVVPTTSTGGGTFRFDYTYNEADQPTSTRYPLDHLGQQGEAVNYTYNSVGQISAVSSISGTYASSASYNPAGQLTQLAQPGLTRQRVYETNTLRLSVVKAGTTSPWDNRQNLTYTYDNAGNVASLVDGQNGTGQKQCFQYDYLYRLTAAFTGNSGCTVYSATGTGPYQHTYAYDAIGNLTSYTGNSYTYGSGKPHAVTAAFGNSYAYDGNGNQTTRTIGGTVYTLVYDYENRLTEVKQGTTVLASFVYDADGNRVKGTVGSTNTVYIAGLYEYSGGAAKSYYTGPGGVVAMRSGGTVYYLLSDHLNSTARIVNSAGTTQSTSYYYPFGGNRGGAFSSLTTRRFTGQYHESSIPGGEGLYFYNARWYDAKLGRFVSADTLVPSPGNPQSFNRYSYVYNNPLKYTDPSGHAGKDVGQCMCGGVGGGDVGGSSLISAILPIRWLIKSEMLPNAQSQVAIRIEHRNTEAAQLMADIGADDNEMASNLGLALQSKSEAYRLWISMVKAGADWDHKGEIREKYREYVQYEGYAYRFDTWSNIHYGFVGRKIGFTSTELLAGAGAAQIKDGTSNIRYWKSWFDEPEDQAGIRIGIEMYETYQLNLTPAQFRHVFDRNAALLSRWKIDIGEYGGGYGSGGDR